MCCKEAADLRVVCQSNIDVVVKKRAGNDSCNAETSDCNKPSKRNAQDLFSYFELIFHCEPEKLNDFRGTLWNAIQCVRMMCIACQIELAAFFLGYAVQTQCIFLVVVPSCAETAYIDFDSCA